MDREQPEAHKVPGQGRPGGIDDPVPDAEYGDVQGNADRQEGSESESDSIEHEDCRRCGGTGEITRMVADRSGLAPCPDCDNVPEYAIPDEIPEDPEGRIAEIDAEIESLCEEKEGWADLRSGFRDAQSGLRAAAHDDLVDSETAIKLAFLADQLSTILHRMDRGPHYSNRCEQLGEEKAKIRTYLDHLEGDG